MQQSLFEKNKIILIGMFFETETMDEFNIVFSHVKIICPRTPEN